MYPIFSAKTPLPGSPKSVSAAKAPAAVPLVNTSDCKHQHASMSVETEQSTSGGA